MIEEPVSDALDSEYALRAHIRQLLLNYAVAHITTDYIQLTEQAVTDLWSQYLVEIPTADPHSLLLPTDPFETLTRIHGLGSAEPFLEKFQSTPSAVQYIKKLRLIKPQSGKPKSDRVVFEESICEFLSWLDVQNQVYEPLQSNLMSLFADQCLQF
ncbi:hypothetical protein B0H17DRAFT_923713 [Mycena rosella]|uniref:Uncharacterized protein n=1 Tax=Mycena rosella TaxID=1033263 RepID=A0AAD7DYG5_MYCRO|nr:hypothetical protein B0H17DRAFT_923713 [Mycena rosella]